MNFSLSLSVCMASTEPLSSLSVSVLQRWVEAGKQLKKQFKGQCVVL